MRSRMRCHGRIKPESQSTGAAADDDGRRHVFICLPLWQKNSAAHLRTHGFFSAVLSDNCPMYLDHPIVRRLRSSFWSV